MSFDICATCHTSHDMFNLEACERALHHKVWEQIDQLRVEKKKADLKFRQNVSKGLIK